MQQSKLFKDPMGNTIMFPVKMMNAFAEKYDGLADVITSPAYMINGKNLSLYFFRLVKIDTNMLIEVHWKKGRFVVKACVENPSEAHITALLKNGALYSFR